MTYRSRSSMTIQTSKCSAHDSPVDALSIQLQKLQSAGIRQSRASALARARNAAALRRLGYVDSQIARLLQSNGGRRDSQGPLLRHHMIFDRIARLRDLSASLLDSERTPVSVREGPYTYMEDTDDQLVRFRFDSEPDKAIRAMLRRAGFRPTDDCLEYSRRLTDKAINAAKQIRKHLKRSFH